MADKRRHRRHPRRFRVQFGVDDLARSGFTGDISSSGCFIVGTPPPIGARVHVQVFIEGSRFLLFEGRVRRHRLVPPELRTIEKMGFGVEFLDAEEIIAEALPQTTARASSQFQITYATHEAFRAAYQAELRFGGVFVATERPLARDAEATLGMELLFLGKRLEFPVRVAQSLSSAGLRGLGFVFTDKVAALSVLHPLANG